MENSNDIMTLPFKTWENPWNSILEEQSGLPVMITLVLRQVLFWDIFTFFCTQEKEVSQTTKEFPTYTYIFTFAYQQWVYIL